MPNLQEGGRYPYPNLPTDLLQKKSFPLCKNLLGLISDIIQAFSHRDLSLLSILHSLVLMVFFLSVNALSSVFPLSVCFEFLSPREQSFSPLSPVSCFSAFSPRKALSPLTSGLVQEHVPKKWREAVCINHWVMAVSEQQDCKKP